MVTDGDLNVLATGPNLAITVPEDLIEGMDDGTRDTTTAAVLLTVFARKVSVLTRPSSTLAFLREWVDENTAPLCGNSVWNDRQFLAKEMPELLDFLHYRMVDVSTVKELSRRWYKGIPRFPRKAPTWPLMISWNPLRNCNTLRARVRSSSLTPCGIAGVNPLCNDMI